MKTMPVAQLELSWVWQLLYGLISIVAGILTVSSPRLNVVALGLICGTQIIATGLFHLSAPTYLTAADTARTLMRVLTILSLTLGFFAFRHIFVSVMQIGLLLGIYWVVDGLITVFIAADPQSALRRGWIALLGLLKFFAGLTLLTSPELSPPRLSFLVGEWLICLGAMQLILVSAVASPGKAY
ncbi:HdeD family acid-resistance protein [Streptomyces sp. NPDC094468]|uniref:HdeD family acid-resistance protein n=1 Tax=Streptomyces sp. NPDC094468 TaxID=3366066 RepID=UPI003809D715